ncbi:MAG: glycosyltransferase family 2 protein [Candidatus Woesearchaeota archaeon]|nr:glycosyltransferase family 2 protein [Candidatus Woesearchaeota archaeon]
MEKSIDVVVPVYNEEKDLERSVRILHSFLSKKMKNYKWRIVIADNASKDNTLSIAKRLSKTMSNVDYIHLDLKGRGRALKKAWLESRADIVSYMDVDLSTDINAFPKMIEGMLKSKCNVATGTRLAKKSKTERSLLREILSRGYNYIVRAILWVKYSDAQCGFKAATRKAVDDIVPLIKDNEWFFDTELLTIAEKFGYGVYEIPVKWVEDPNSKVRIFRTVSQYIRDVLRLRFELWFSRDLRKLKYKVNKI